MGVRSEQLLREQAALLAEIDAAFAGVNREGGVSWSESVVLDSYGDAPECAAARRSDTDRHWSELVDNNKRWEADIGVGGWSFLDAIGFRYYLPAAMKRCIASGVDEGIEFHLTYGGRRSRGVDLDQLTAEQHALLDARQRACVARFVRFMIDVSTEEEWGEVSIDGWQKALDSHWHQYLRSP